MGESLPVWAVVKRSYGYVWRNRGLLALPLLITLALQLAVGALALWVTALTIDLSFLIQLPMNFVWAILTIAVAMSYTVGLYRTVLLDERREGIAFLRWDRYLWNYAKACLFALLVCVTLMAVFTAALVLPLGIGNALMLLMMHGLPMYAFLLLLFLVILFVWLKFGLAFSAAALGYRGVFSLSWRLTEGNLLRLLVTFLLVYLPFLLLNFVQLPPIDRFGLVWLLLKAVLRLVSLTLLTVATSLNFFFLFKTSDEFGEV